MIDETEFVEAATTTAAVYVALAAGAVGGEFALLALDAPVRFAEDVATNPESLLLFAVMLAPVGAAVAGLAGRDRAGVTLGATVGSWVGLVGFALLASVGSFAVPPSDVALSEAILGPLRIAPVVGLGVATTSAIVAFATVRVRRPETDQSPRK